MRLLSPDDVIPLGRTVGVEVDGAEVEAVRETANELLSHLDALDDLPIEGRNDDGPGRSWHESDDDPHNAVAVACDVPPAGEGVMSGRTVGVKDIVAVAGVPMSCGSAVAKGLVPGTDATVVSRLLREGAHVTAKLALDEFAGSARGTTGIGGPIRNPHDPERTAGGSSGGSAAAVAEGRVDVALGTDTGGSIRIPAGLCGVVGHKPTYGLVPLTGVVENTYTQDHVGPLARSVEDAARCLAAVAGKDPADPGSMAAAGRDDYRVGDPVGAVEEPPAPGDLALAVLEEGLADAAEGVAERTEAAIDGLADAGASVERVSVEHFEAGLAIKDALSVSELAAHWRAGAAPYRRGGIVDEGYQAGMAARMAARSGELDPYYKGKLLAGARVLEGHRGRPYVRAQAAREVLAAEFEAALAGVDAILLPTLPDVAPRIVDAADPGFDYGRNTRAADVTRLPAVTLPNGLAEELPVGLQLLGDAFGDDRLLGVAVAVENTIDRPD